MQNYALISRPFPPLRGLVSVARKGAPNGHGALARELEPRLHGQKKKPARKIGGNCSAQKFVDKTHARRRDFLTARQKLFLG